MTREIKSPPPTILTSTSFDGKHSLEFNEGSHRYKWTCPCHLKASAVGATTFLKSGYVTSMGLISWFKSQTGEAVFNALTVPGQDGYYPREGFYPITTKVHNDIIKEAKLADRSVSQEAADIGTICHGYAELHSLGQIEAANKLLDQVRNAATWPLIEMCVTKYKGWDAQNKGSLVHAEGLVASPTFLFCGKFDRLDLIDGRLILRDYKTSKDIFLEQYIQLAAYAIAIKEWLGLDVSGLEVLRFGKDDGTFDALLVDDPQEIQIFKDQAIRCRYTHEFRKLESDPRWKWEAKK